jgi:ribonuclease BN (tRNA processing enzyme)
VAHPVEAYAVRVHEDVAAGGTLVFSGDTGPCRALVDLAREADLLLCEAGFRHREDNPPNLHMSGRQAAETATEAGVGALVLTHIPPWHEPDQILR